MHIISHQSTAARWSHVMLCVVVTRWLFAYNFVLGEHVRRRRSMWSWERIQTHRQYFREYRRLWVIKLTSYILSTEDKLDIEVGSVYCHHRHCQYRHQHISSYVFSAQLKFLIDQILQICGECVVIHCHLHYPALCYDALCVAICYIVCGVFCGYVFLLLCCPPIVGLIMQCRTSLCLSCLGCNSCSSRKFTFGGNVPCGMCNWRCFKSKL